MTIDDARLDHLLRCMEINREYISEQREERERWRTKIQDYSADCISEMKRFVLENIFSTSLTSLQEEYGLPVVLARRILNRKCLWLVRMSEVEIAKLHVGVLTGQYNPEGQSLDIVELVAIYSSLPTSFIADSGAKKLEWRLRIENSVKEVILAKERNLLPQSKIRHPAYDLYYK